MARPPTPGEAYGKEGEFFICATCGKSIPITEIKGQCYGCGKKVCTECGGKYPLCAKCGWVICRNCASFDKRDQKWYHSICKPPGCLIVTACFGSPHVKEVQYLRVFRDRIVLETPCGHSIMNVLERIYYSFSPQVASYLRNHLTTREVVRSMIVVPLLQSLSTTEHLTRSITNRELRVSLIAWLSLINSTIGLVFWKVMSFLRKE